MGTTLKKRTPVQKGHQYASNSTFSGYKDLSKSEQALVITSHGYKPETVSRAATWCKKWKIEPSTHTQGLNHQTGQVKQLAQVQSEEISSWCRTHKI
jgi:L-asparaginase II